MEYNYRTKGVCSSNIKFDIDGDKITNAKFTGGCDGNLKAISSLIDGMTVEQIERKCKGIRCGRKTTSCSDQLSRAVREAYEVLEQKAQ